ncbi:MAG: hypothetical protein VCD50_17705 [Alphaproteobacteria bacterium]|jgi:hypothetical protein
MAGFWQKVNDVWSSGMFGVSLGDVLAAVAIFFLFLVPQAAIFALHHPFHQDRNQAHRDGYRRRHPRRY